MAPDPSSLDPGSMTVPPLFGWEHIVVVLALMAVVAAAFLLHSVTRGSVHARSDWQSWLDARSGRQGYPAGAARQRAAETIHPSRLAHPAARDDGSRPVADGPG
jgi:hypothetical protein